MGTSTVGAGAGSVALALNVPIEHEEVTIAPGDLVVSDVENGGVVVIPRDKVGEVVELIPRLVEADEKVKRDVGAGGMSLTEAFATHRKGL